MTTGLTTGPYTLTNGVSLSLVDPYRYSSPAATVQLQNNTGFLLTVQSSGAPYTIQPYTATTIPTILGGQSVIVLPTAATPNQVGQLSAVWLLDGQDPPIPDGPLTGGIANQKVAYGPTTLSGSQTFTVPLSSSDQAISLVISSAGPLTVLYSVTGTQSGIVYSATGLGSTITWSSSSTQVRGPWPVYGAIDTSVTVVITVVSGTASYTAEVLTYTYPQVYAQNIIVNQTPGNPLDVVTYGGLSSSSINLTSTTTTTLLAAPASGTATRVHSISVFGNTAAQTVRFQSGGSVIAILAAGTTPGAFLLDGLLVTTSITVTSSAATSIFAYIFYDNVVLPSIS